MLRRNAIASLLATGGTLAAGCGKTPNSSEANSAGSANGILTNNRSHHPEFDLDYWKALLAHKIEPSSGTAQVQLPDAFLSNEALRERVRAAGIDLGPPQPVDLFFWSSQSPSKPWLTKYGGLPYRSKNKPWPEKAGVPATFVVQLCFRDSLDIFDRKPPGDLLTVFSVDSEVVGHDESDPNYPIIVEWETIDEVETPLDSTERIHRAFEVPELSGLRHRSYDYAFSSSNEGDLRQALVPIAGLSWTSVISLPGTKIGRTYYPVQPGWDPRDWIKEEFDHDHWQLVATLYSVDLSSNLEWAVLDKQRGEASTPGFRMGDPGHLIMFSHTSREARSYFVFG